MGHPASAQAGTKRRDVESSAADSDAEESAEYAQLLLQDRTLARQTSVEMIEDEIADQEIYSLNICRQLKSLFTNKAELENK